MTNPSQKCPNFKQKHKGFMKLFTLMTATLAIFGFSSTEGVTLSFENSPPISYHVENNLHVLTKMGKKTGEFNDLSSVDFVINFISEKEFFLKIKKFTYTVNEKIGKKSYKTVFDSSNSKKRTKSKNLDAIILNLIGKEMHFVGDQEGTMREITGFLNEVEQELMKQKEIRTEFITEKSYNEFFQDLFVLSDEDLQVNNKYTWNLKEVSLDRLFFDGDDFPSENSGLTLHATVKNIDNNSIQANFIGSTNKTKYIKSGNIMAKGTMNWDAKNSFLKQGSIGITFEAKVPTGAGQATIEGSYNQKISSKIAN